MRLLVVDADNRIREALRRALMLAGHEVEIAAGGEQGLVQALATQPDAVLLDDAMPDVDALEVCRRLRVAGGCVPVLILTARDRLEDRIASLDAGADDYLVKPFDLRELEARLQALVRRAAWRRPPQNSRTVPWRGAPAADALPTQAGGRALDAVRRPAGQLLPRESRSRSSRVRA